VAKQYRPWAPTQSFLLPPSPSEWLPEGHLAFFILEVVDELDISAIENAIQEKDPRGERPYSPKMMTALILYAYCSGIFSSRKIERATYEDVALRVIAGGTHPHFTSVNRFRLDHRHALSGIFVQVLKLCTGAGLKTVGHVSLDGSKVQANASKHKAMSYGRMKTDEKRLQEEIEALMRKAEQVDAAEDAEYGADVRGDEIPEELRHRESRLKKIREVKAALEKEAANARAARLRENAEELRKKISDENLPARDRHAAATLSAKAKKQAKELSRDDDDDDRGGGATQLTLHSVPNTRDGKPKNSAQRNFTDADSRIMIRNGVFMQAYNAQAAVSTDQIIVAHGLTNNPADAEQLAPMLERVLENTGSRPEIVTADTGYLSDANVTYCTKNGVDAYIGLRKHDAQTLTQVPATEHLITRWDMREKITSPRGKKIYALRKIIVEPVFGQIKAAMGFRHFMLRGLAKVTCEWGIICTCHNLLKLFRARRLAPA
jgi:transposase/IS5 family transposase